MKRLPLALVVLLLASTAFAKNGAFRATAHGDTVKGPDRRTDVPRGSCVQCHEEHASHAAAARDDRGLFTSNDNELCFACHPAATESGIFPGAVEWQQSAHALSTSAANRCDGCHDAHGVRDAAGVIPAMLREREPELCLRCHDGSRGAADIRSEMRKPYAHAREARGAHDPHEGNDRALPRHAACSDCHNPHRAMTQVIPPQAPEASSRLAGVSRVESAAIAAGVTPLFTWRAGGDATAPNEYEICFKCHSSWTRQPPGQDDIALQTSTASRSFHPIQAGGRNRHIDRAAFTGDWDADSRVSCTDCHSSDDDRVRGPHGSSYPHLLRKPLPSDGEPASRGDLCFECHAYDVYADPAATESIQRASRFSVSGHTFHAGTQQIACASCHEVHGSAREEALISTRRMPGIRAYTQTQAGGTCTSTCHSTKSYSASYAR